MIRTPSSLQFDSSMNHDIFNSMQNTTVRPENISSSNCSIHPRVVGDTHIFDTSTGTRMNMANSSSFPLSLTSNYRAETRNQNFLEGSSNFLTPNQLASHMYNTPTATFPAQITNHYDIPQQNHTMYLQGRQMPGIISASVLESVTRSKVSDINSNYGGSNSWTPTTNRVHQQPAAESNSIATKIDAVAKKSIPLSMKCDKHYLSEFQCLVRKQIEIFEA